MYEHLIPIKIEPLDEGGYLATSEALQGLIAQGRTIAETMEIAQDVARKLIESYLEHGDPLPFPLPDKKTSKVALNTNIPVAVMQGITCSQTRGSHSKIKTSRICL